MKDNKTTRMQIGTVLTPSVLFLELVNLIVGWHTISSYLEGYVLTGLMGTFAFVILSDKIARKLIQVHIN